MKFPHLGSVLAFGAAVSAQNAAVYELAANPRPYGAVAFNDSLLYFADKLGVSNHYTLGNSDKTFDFLSHVHAAPARASKAPLVVIVTGVAEPAAFFSHQPAFEIDLGARHELGRELVAALQDRMPLQMDPVARAGALKLGSNDADWLRKMALVLGGAPAAAAGPQQALGVHGAALSRDHAFVAEFRQLQNLAAAGLDVPVVFSVDLVGAVAMRAGVSSAAYKVAARTLAGALEAASAAFDVTVVVLGHEITYVSSRISKRSAGAPFVRRGTVSAALCFADEDACDTATSGCSGHGTCVEVQSECWQCACASSYDKTASKTTKWAGADCSKKDVSAPAHLLLWTSVVLVGTLVVGVKLLFSIGSAPLPGVLEAATVKRSN